MILPADKENVTVAMKRSDYDERTRGMLDDTTTYRKPLKDPTAIQEARIGRTLLRLHSNREIPKSIYNRIRPTGSCPPRIYGLPNIHKPQTLLRPIVSCIGVPSYKLSFASVISPLAGRTSSHVPNSKHFTDVMKEERVEADEALVSFAVTSCSPTSLQRKQWKSYTGSSQKKRIWWRGPHYHRRGSQSSSSSV